MPIISPTSLKHNQEVPPPLNRLRWGDGVLILLVLTATILTIPAFSTLTPACAEIFLENTLIATYPLAEDRIISVQGHNGPVQIAIKKHSVSIEHATCPRGVCRKTGFISKPHAQIVCAPNHILVSISSTKPDTLDAVAR